MNSPTLEAGVGLLDDFVKHAPALPGSGSPALRALRDEAAEVCLRRGLPTQRDEDWKYTSLAAIARGEFTVAPASVAALARERLDAIVLPGTTRLVFIDGIYAPHFSDAGDLPAAARVTSLGEMFVRDPDRLVALLRRRPVGERSALDALNLACARDGAFIELGENCRLESPLHLLFIASCGRLAAHARTLIVAGADSAASVIEHHVGETNAAYWTNCVTEASLARGARIEHHKLQQEGSKAVHTALVRAQIEADASFASTSLSLGAALARVDIEIALKGEKASCALDGLYLADGRQHVDHHTTIEHQSGRCTSRELYKGIVGGAARAVFNGKVIVATDAQQSDAAQANHNLLLSDQAEIDTKPQLEIWADDVKCSHAATVGQLDAEQVFYLRSRGIAENEARAMLTRGFAAEVIARVGFAPLRERAEHALGTRYAKTP